MIEHEGQIWSDSQVSDLVNWIDIGTLIKKRVTELRTILGDIKETIWILFKLSLSIDDI